MFSLENDRTVQGNSSNPCNQLFVLIFVSEQVVPDGYISKAFKLGFCIPSQF